MIRNLLIILVLIIIDTQLYASTITLKNKAALPVLMKAEISGKTVRTQKVLPDETFTEGQDNGLFSDPSQGVKVNVYMPIFPATIISSFQVDLENDPPIKNPVGYKVNNVAPGNFSIQHVSFKADGDPKYKEVPGGHKVIVRWGLCSGEII